MPFSKSTKPELLLARYRSLLDDVPVVVFTALSATAIQIIAFKDELDWQVSVGMALVRMTFSALIFLYWFQYRDNNPTLQQVRWRLRVASIVLVIAGVMSFLRTLFLFQHSDTFGHYFLIIYVMLHGLCFAFILSKIGVAAYIYNFLLVAAALCCINLGQFEHPHLLTILVLVFEIGMLLAMRASSQVFDRLVNATHETHGLLEENQRLANQDALTQLPNRRQFFEHVQQHLAQATQMAGKLVVGIIDLDKFKPVNDAYGHRVGDLVLVEVGRRLAGIQLSGVQFYRLGGDEFAFHAMTGGEQGILQQLGGEINQLISQPMDIEGLPITIQASIGACVFSSEQQTAQSLYEHADFALYQVKRTGRGYMEVYSQTLAQERLQLGKVDHALRTAHLENELYPVFQPIVNVHTGAVTSFESLARWRSPDIGEVSPNVFIEAAENQGVISGITQLMFRKSIQAMTVWPARIRLSFNLSAHDVTNKTVVKTLAEILTQSGHDPSRFIFEITETALLQDFATARENIELLRQAGARIALDDFGTGYSSLSHVQNLPLDKLKIDRSFIRDIETSATSQAIVRAILALCHGMQIECVAEGAETQSQVAFLQQLGCQLIQGYVYSPPLQQVHITDYLAALRSPTDDTIL